MTGNYKKILMALLVIILCVQATALENESCADFDNDTICDVDDNCRNVPNTDQMDMDNDDIGDLCDDCIDPDADGICNKVDNCPNAYNPEQEDMDSDGTGDKCDMCNDPDHDDICSIVDNCPAMYNPTQEDADNNGIGDLCEGCTDENQNGICDEGEPIMNLIKIEFKVNCEKELKQSLVNYWKDITVNNSDNDNEIKLLKYGIEFLLNCREFDQEFSTINTRDENETEILKYSRDIDENYLQILRMVSQGNYPEFPLESFQKVYDHEMDKVTGKLNQSLKNSQQLKSKKEVMEHIGNLLESSLNAMRDEGAQDKKNISEIHRDIEHVDSLISSERSRLSTLKADYMTEQKKQKSGLFNYLLISLIIGILAGTLVSYWWKKEKEYWSLFSTSSYHINPVTLALIISAVLLLIFLLFIFLNGIKLGELYGM